MTVVTAEMMDRAHLPRVSRPVALAVLVLCLPLLAACTSVPNLDKLLANAQAPAQTTFVYAGDGSLITSLHAEVDRQIIPLEDVPVVVREAVIAIEDARFYQHPGVDYRSVARAFTANAAAGHVVEGGSTITQQLVKNVLVGNERTFKRKVQEAILAFQLEQKLTKDQILERYLNTVYFGRGAYGVEAAARSFFGKDAKDLTLPDAALLAGLIRSPSTYDPEANPKIAIARRNLVLKRMTDEHMITEQQHQAARKRPLGLHTQPEFQPYPDAYFIDYVKQRIVNDDAFKAIGATPQDRNNALFKGGLRIYTTIDPHLQRVAEKISKQTLPNKRDPYTAFVAVDPNTGNIISMIGGRNYFDKKDPYAKFNLATESRRQPGSSFKPFTLAAALEHGISLNSVWRGGSRVFLRLPDGETWNPGNYEGINFGSRLTLLQATADSINVVFAQVVLKIGPQAVVEMAHRLGITSPIQPNYAIALGSEVVNPLEMAGAYSTFANGGYRVDPTPVTKITDANGKVLWQHKVVKKRVLNPAIAALVDKALQAVMTQGTGRQIQLGRPAGGKTGTSEEYHDAWFAGFTPQMVGIRWVGFPQSESISMRPPRTRITVFGSSWPGHMWQSWMLEALKGKPAIPFPTAEEAFVKVKIDTSRNCLPNQFTPPYLIEERSYLKGSEPTQVCTEPTSGDIPSTPNVLGMKESAARDALGKAGFDVITLSQYCPAFVQGTVCDQTPSPGSAGTVGERAYIYVSNDQAVEQVPMVLGRTADRAKQKLEEYGYKVSIVVKQNTDGFAGCQDPAETESGRVWLQNPCGGANYGKGSVVTIFVNP